MALVLLPCVIVQNPRHFGIFLVQLFTKSQYFGQNQIQSICRRQIMVKLQSLCLIGLKTLLEKEKMLVTSIFSLFSHDVFKRLLSQGRLKSGLCSKELSENMIKLKLGQAVNYQEASL